MRRNGHTPLDHALHDGEDYELLLTGRLSEASNSPIAIGVITSETEIWLVKNRQRNRLNPRGWEHSF